MYFSRLLFLSLSVCFIKVTYLFPSDKQTSIIKEKEKKEEKEKEKLSLVKQELPWRNDFRDFSLQIFLKTFLFWYNS